MSFLVIIMMVDALAGLGRARSWKFYSRLESAWCRGTRPVALEQWLEVQRYYITPLATTDI